LICIGAQRIANAGVASSSVVTADRSRTLLPRRKLLGPTERVLSLAMRPEGDQVMSISAGERIHLWAIGQPAARKPDTRGCPLPFARFATIR
jgi:hypothetical protein